MASSRPGGFLQNIRAKLSESLREFTGPFPDALEQRLSGAVERATSDLLTGPDWGANFEIVDTINNDPTGCSDKVYRALQRSLLRPNPHVQLLALALLEACVRNCVPFFFQQLIYSDLWSELMRAGEPTRGWDPEVRDRALCLVEDFGRGLPLHSYKEAYESLLDRGVDFPVRPDGGAAAAAGAAYYTPPPPPAAATAAAAGVSPEDRAAIAAAVADLEAAAAAQDERDAALAPPGLPAAGHVPAAMGPAVLMGAPIRPPGYAPPPGYHAPHAAAPPPMVAGAPAIPATTDPSSALMTAAAPSDEEVGTALRVARNSSELLIEMLSSGGGADMSDPLLTDLVGQCERYKAVLLDMIPRLSQETQISEALAVNDDVCRALQMHQAACGGSLPPGGGAGGALLPGVGGSSSSGGAGAATLATGGAAGTAAAFTLLGEDEDEEPTTLQTRRGGTAGGASATAAGTSSSGPVDTDTALVADMDKLLLAQGSSSGGASAPPPQ